MKLRRVRTLSIGGGSANVACRYCAHFVGYGDKSFSQWISTQSFTHSGARAKTQLYSHAAARNFRLASGVLCIFRTVKYSGSISYRFQATKVKRAGYFIVRTG